MILAVSVWNDATKEYRMMRRIKENKNNIQRKKGKYGWNKNSGGRKEKETKNKDE